MRKTPSITSPASFKTAARRYNRRRKLSVENLELRQLLSADVALSLVSTDSSGSGNVYLSRPVDYNGDGLLDMATANNGNNTLNIYLGTNNGLFSLKSTISTQGVEPYGSDSGDFNGDGILDIAVANNGTSSISVFLGDVVHFTSGEDVENH